MSPAVSASASEIRILNAADVRRLLPMADCIDLMDKAMRAVSDGSAVLPLRSLLRMPGAIGAMGQMHGYLPDPSCFGIKLVSLFPRNTPPEYSSHLGVVLLFEADHGRPVALLDAAEITAIRTAAASGLATRLLAREDAGDLALLGAGEQAQSHLAAMLAVRPLRRVRVWARDAAKAAAFAATEGARHGITVEPTADARAAVADADIICTVTKSREPILFSDWIMPGAHVNLVGSSFAGAVEVDTATVSRGRYFVDYRGSAIHEAGEYLNALAEGAIGPEHIVAEIGEVAAGASIGRRDGGDLTIYKSLGIAAQDLASAAFVLDRARREGVGQVVAF
jgi:ornithine cyclodeaminase/alanine dehydrogenase-like protein (mu-crystallin family)